MCVWQSLPFPARGSYPAVRAGLDFHTLSYRLLLHFQRLSYFPTPTIMSDSTPSQGVSLPPPPNTGSAPGQAGYENGNQSHMPPPLNIPQNNSNVQPAGHDILSPMSAGVSRAAPEPNKRALYVGGLDQRVTEDVLKQIFETTGHVQSVKIIPDKNVSRPTCRVGKPSRAFQGLLEPSQSLTFFPLPLPLCTFLTCKLFFYFSLSSPSVQSRSKHPHEVLG